MKANYGRIIVAPNGVRYDVRITPRETPSGLSRTAKSLVFENRDRGWIGALPVRPSSSLEDWTEAELLLLFREAQRWL